MSQNTVWCHYYVVEFLKIPSNRHSIVQRWRWDMEHLLLVQRSDFCSAFVIKVLYMILWNIGQCYNCTWLYMGHKVYHCSACKCPSTQWPVLQKVFPSCDVNMITFYHVNFWTCSDCRFLICKVLLNDWKDKSHKVNQIMKQECLLHKTHVRLRPSKGHTITFVRLRSVSKLLEAMCLFGTRPSAAIMMT